MATPRKKRKKGSSKKALKSAAPQMLIIPEWTGTIQTSFGPVNVTIPEREVELPPCECCNACDLPSDQWGFVWHQDGEYFCLPGPTVANVVKTLKCDKDGPFLANE